MTAPQHHFPYHKRDLINPESATPLRLDSITLTPHEMAHLIQQGRIERSMEFRRILSWIASKLRALVA